MYTLTLTAWFNVRPQPVSLAHTGGLANNGEGWVTDVGGHRAKDSSLAEADISVLWWSQKLTVDLCRDAGNGKFGLALLNSPGFPGLALLNSPGFPGLASLSSRVFPVMF